MFGNALVGLCAACVNGFVAWSELGRGRPGGHVGLNPAGAAMLVGSLVLVLVSAFSGWMQITLRFFGVDWVQELHTWSSYAVLVLAAIHIMGVALASVLQRQNYATIRSSYSATYAEFWARVERARKVA